MNQHVSIPFDTTEAPAFTCVHRHDLSVVLLAARAAQAAELSRRGQRLTVEPSGGACPVHGPTRALADALTQAISIVSAHSDRGADLSASIVEDAGEMVLVVAGEAPNAGGLFAEAAAAADWPLGQAGAFMDETGPVLVLRFDGPQLGFGQRRPL
jgi:hypothetical protein